MSTKFSHRTTLLAAALTAMASCAYANTPASRIIIAPNCLLQQVHAPYTTLAKTEELSLISLGMNSIPALMHAKHAPDACGGFKDVTASVTKHNIQLQNKTHVHAFLVKQSRPQPSLSHASYAIRYEATVNPLLKQINPQNIWNDIVALTNFENRYANSTNGKMTAEWLKTTVETLARNNVRNDVNVTLVKTSGYKQPSVVAKVGDGDGPGIVIGAHMDTIVMGKTRQPGADDDGSGTATSLETLRVLLNNGMHFKKPLYFIWYAAEEEGLVGSQDVVSDFIDKKIPVDAVLQFDMTGFTYHNDPTLWLMTDHVNKSLTDFVEKLANTYVQQPVKRTRCGYACSDHASWTDEGFNAAMPFEAKMGSDNPAIHTTRDTMDKISLSHMTNFAKLGVAFMVELAEPLN